MADNRRPASANISSHKKYGLYYSDDYNGSYTNHLDLQKAQERYENQIDSKLNSIRQAVQRDPELKVFQDPKYSRWNRYKRFHSRARERKIAMRFYVSSTVFLLASIVYMRADGTRTEPRLSNKFLN